MLLFSAAVKSESRFAYTVQVERSPSDFFAEKLLALGRVRTVLVVSDTNVDAIHGGRFTEALRNRGLRVLKYVMEPRRKRKSLASVRDIFRLLFDEGADRDTIIVNLGGGTVGDLGGFAAALYLRGIRYAHLPTTLVGQADSGIGGKVNVNFGDHVNSVSVFCHPAAVWIDPDLLGTLPREEFLCGLAEIAKYAAVLDPELFAALEGNAVRLADSAGGPIDPIIVRCVEKKCAIVSEDPLEQSRFRLFNYGHEIGHAVEVAYDYHHLRHGEAVAIGMHATAWLGVEAGFTDPEFFERQGRLLSAMELPTSIPAPLRRRWRPDRLADRLHGLLHTDKKRTSAGIVWIMPLRPGNAVVTSDVGPELVARCIERVARGATD